MTYWTVLWIAMLGGLYDGQASFVVYPSLETCEAAILDVSNTIPYDHQIECEETTTPSSSIRPMPRPEGLGE